MRSDDIITEAVSASDRMVLCDLPEINGCPYRDGLVIVERKGGGAPCA